MYTLKCCLFAFLALVAVASAQQDRTYERQTTYRAVDRNNFTNIDVEALSASLDRAGSEGRAGYEKFLEQLRSQREQLERQYQQLTDAAQANVRGSLDRADAWKENARSEAQESMKRLEEFRSRAEAKSAEFHKTVASGSPVGTSRFGTTLHQRHHHLRCEDVENDSDAQRLGVSEEDRRIICEESYSTGSSLVASVLLGVGLVILVPVVA